MRTVIQATLLLACAALPACAANVENARLNGTVMVDAQHDRYHGAPIRVAFRARTEDQDRCDADLAACLSDSSWDGLKSCSLEAATRVTAMRITIGDNAHPFEACTGEIELERDVEVLAFIDLDEDGHLGPGEPYGLRDAGKASAKLAQLTVAIDSAR